VVFTWALPTAPSVPVSARDHAALLAVVASGHAARARIHRGDKREIAPGSPPCPREIVTAPSSSGARNVSRTEGETSASSSRKDLGHACGSLLICEGVKPKFVQAILRHSMLSTTTDLYVHAYDEDLRGAVATLDRALGS